MPNATGEAAPRFHRARRQRARSETRISVQRGPAWSAGASPSRALRGASSTRAAAQSPRRSSVVSESQSPAAQERPGVPHRAALEARERFVETRVELRAGDPQPTQPARRLLRDRRTAKATIRKKAVAQVEQRLQAQ